MKKTLFFYVLLFSVFSFAAGSSSHDSHAIPFDKIGWQAANLGILLIAIFFLIKKSIKELFENRKKSFIEKSEKTKSALIEAEVALTEIKTKLAQLEAGEKNAIENAAREANLLKNNLIKESETQAEKLKSESQMIIKNEIEKVKTDIANHIFKNAIQMSTQKISNHGNKITKDSEIEFLNQISQVKA